MTRRCKNTETETLWEAYQKAVAVSIEATQLEIAAWEAFLVADNAEEVTS